jgi:hypothetical protein
VILKTIITRLKLDELHSLSLLKAASVICFMSLRYLALNGLEALVYHATCLPHLLVRINCAEKNGKCWSTLYAMQKNVELDVLFVSNISIVGVFSLHFSIHNSDKNDDFTSLQNIMTDRTPPLIRVSILFKKIVRG